MKIFKVVAAIPLLFAVGFGSQPVLAADGATTVSSPHTSTTGKKAVKKKATTKKTASKSSRVKRTRVSRGSSAKSIRQVSYSRSRGRTPSHAAVGALAEPSVGEIAGLNLTHDPLELKSNAAFVIDQESSQILFDKNSEVALPIASLTKLMTTLVVVEAHQDMDEMLTVTEDDVDHLKHSTSRLRVGSVLSRADMLHIALMSSENRAASALGRYYPGGTDAVVAAMNAKARMLGMSEAHYVEPTGLSSQNVASARDLAKLVKAAYNYSIIRQYSTDSSYTVEPGNYSLHYTTSNHLVDSDRWDIGLQKTGFINEAGHCMVMQSKLDGRDVIMVFLDSKGKYSRIADADRVRKWVDKNQPTTETGKRALQAQS